MSSPTLTLTWTKAGDQTAQAVTISGGGAHQHIEDTIAGSTTDKQVNCAIDASNLKGIYLLATGALTLQANDSSSPDFTITLSANKPFVWYDGCGITKPITADVTEFYVTNAGGSSVDLDIYVEQDPTP